MHAPRIALLLTTLMLSTSALQAAPEAASSSTWKRAIAKVRAIPSNPVSNDHVVPPRKTGHTVPLKSVTWDEIESMRILGHANLPLKVLMVLSSSTRDEVQGVFDVVRDLHREQEAANFPKNERVKLHLVINRPSDVARLDITPEDYQDIVEIDQWFQTGDIWMQDWGEVAAAKLKTADKERTLIFDSGRGRGSRPLPEDTADQPDPGTRGLKGLSHVLARLWNANMVKAPESNGVKGNYGGNIEVTPDDVMIIGNTSTSALRSKFAGAGYADSMAVVETDWLVVGHVDEYLSTLPAPETDLGYVVVRADPGAALQSIADATQEEWDASQEGLVEAAFRQVERFPEVLSGESRVRGLHNHLDDLRAALTSRGDEAAQERGRGLLSINRRSEEIIARNVVKLKAQLAALHGREVDVQVLSFPGLFRSSGGRYVALLPGVANMVVLADRLIIPDPLLPGMRDSIRASTEALGYKPKFVSDLTYHFSHGQLHCGTNVFRHPNRYVHPRYDQSRKSAQLHGE